MNGRQSGRFKETEHAGWIKCNEKKPGGYRGVMVTDGKIVRYASLFPCGNWFDLIDVEKGGGRFETPIPVTQWMPTPTAPKRSEDKYEWFAESEAYGEWIDIQKEKPSIGALVIVTDEWKSFCATLCENGVWYELYDGKGYLSRSSVPIRVTRWMPLPDIPAAGR